MREESRSHTKHGDNNDSERILGNLRRCPTVSSSGKLFGINIIQVHAATGDSTEKVIEILNDGRELAKTKL